MGDVAHLFLRFSVLEDTAKSARSRAGLTCLTYTVNGILEAPAPTHHRNPRFHWLLTGNPSI